MEPVDPPPAPEATPVVQVPARRPPRWIAPTYLVMAALMVPWIIVLADSLPDRAISANYRLAWVGFDVLLAVALARTAWLAWTCSPFIVNVASGTAMLLVVDAWFDVTTSPGGRPLLEAVAAAVFVELPLAALSIAIGRRAQAEIARTGAVRRYRWELPDDVLARPVAAPRGPQTPSA